jgi:uncharacterized glyoxalase superfamily protein PhnB
VSTDRPEVALILKSADVEATLAWYQRVGFQVRGRWPEDGPATWCELARDDLAIAFVGGETPWPGSPAMTGCLYVHPPSVRAVHEEIKDSVRVEWGIEERDWGTRELVLQDPDGYYLAFSEPID